MLLTIEQRKFQFETKKKIKTLKEAIKTIKTLQYDIDVTTDSEEVGDLLDKALRPLRNQTSDLEEELKRLETERVSNEVYHDSNHFNTGE